MFNLKALEPKDRALLGILFGKTRVGKSGACGTFGKNTLYLHTNTEAHGAAMAAKVCKEEHPKVAVYPVNISVVEQTDLDNKLFTKPLGSKLDATQSIEKLTAYITNCPKNIGAIVIDSLTDISNILSNTDKFISICSKSGKYNNFAERAAFEEMFQDFISVLAIPRDKGIDCVCTIAANYTYDDKGNPISLRPELPMFGVVETVLKSFPDVFPVERVEVDLDDGGQKEVIAFSMNMKVGKVQYGLDKKKKNETFSSGRITSLEVSLPLGAEVGLIKADFSKLRDSIAALKED